MATVTTGRKYVKVPDDQLPKPPPLQKYVLAYGIHQGPDYGQKPRMLRGDEDQEPTPRWPTKTWSRGSVVESPIDLVLKFGEKFTYPVQQEAQTIEELDAQQKEIDRRRAVLLAQGQPSTKLAPSDTERTGEQKVTTIDPTTGQPAPSIRVEQPAGPATTTSESGAALQPTGGNGGRGQSSHGKGGR